MTENLYGIARAAEELANSQAGDLVVDIGCNDGTLLDGYSAEHVNFLGFDPSDVARYAVEKGYDVVNDFFSGPALQRRYPDQKAKVVTSIAMFYDLEDPASFVADVAESLAEEGVWVMELHYLPTMLETNSFDAIVHEHLEYYSLAVLERLLGESGLEVVSAELNDMNGGSIRLFIAHAGTVQPAAGGRRPSPGAADPRVRDGAGLAGALRGVRPQCRTGARRARRAVPLTDRRRQGHPRLWRLDQGQHDPPVRGSRPLRDPLRGRPQRRQVGLGDDPHEDPDHQRGGLAQDEPRLLPRAALALPVEFLERERDYLEGGGQFIVPLPEVRVIGSQG